MISSMLRSSTSILGIVLPLFPFLFPGRWRCWGCRLSLMNELRSSGGQYLSFLLRTIKTCFKPKFSPFFLRCSDQPLLLIFPCLLSCPCSSHFRFVPLLLHFL